MQTIQDILKNKRKELNLSLRDAAKLIGISHSYLSTLEKGKDPRTNAPINPTPETLKLISKAYTISYKYLMQICNYLDDTKSITLDNSELEKHQLTKRDKTDIAKDLQNIMNDIDNADGLTFYNEPLDEVDRELLKNALNHALESVKIKNKEKYTPKKYKNK
jgi:transcriptional regulator with XRE-family HTH domain